MEQTIWQGPYAWPGFEKINKLESIPDVAGVYLFTFKYNDGFLVYAAGITKSTKRRISTHSREYRKGSYNVLDVDFAEKGQRKEIWHGWAYSNTHQAEFIEHKATILNAVENQLKSFRLFIAEVADLRKRERIEAAIMRNIYASEEYWSQIADRGMFLKGRYNSEIPIDMNNVCSEKMYGLPERLDV